MRELATVLCAAALLFPAGPRAQTRPDITGKWVLDAQKTAAATPEGTAWVSPITIAMTATAVRLTVPSKDGSGTATTYRLDAPMKKIRMMPMRGGEVTEETSTASIEGEKVVIRTAGTNGDSVVSWYREGAWLVNERSSKAGTSKSFYRKG